MARILFGDAARDALHRSLARSVRAAAATCAPLHCTVLYDRRGQPRQARDGFEAVRETAEDAGAYSIGARILKETLAEAQRDLGDGTARLALFIGAAMTTGARQIAAGVSSSAFADALLALQVEVEAALQARRAPAPPPDVIAGAWGMEPDLVQPFARAIDHTGFSGAIDLRAGQRDESGLETGHGFLIELDPVSSNLPPAIGARLGLTRPHVLVVNDMLSDLGRLTPLLDQFATRGKSLAIIARGASGPALDTLVVNGRLPGTTLTAMQPNAVGLGAVSGLEDLAIATGATVIDPVMGIGLDHIRPSMLGRAEALVVSRGLACFEGPGGDAAVVMQRRSDINAAFERQRYLSLDREQLARRESRLSGRWARLTLSPRPGEALDETEARVAALRKYLAQMRAAEAGGVLPHPRRMLMTLAAFHSEAAIYGADERNAARVTLSAGLKALADGCGDVQWEALPVLIGIVQKAISATATMLRIAAIVAD